MDAFQITTNLTPTGDQPQAIEKLVNGLLRGLTHQTILGVTGSGKTFTMAQVIQRIQRPALVIAHNKTLVAQLYNEFRELFPRNCVEYFVSYYDYYQPEAYIPSTDTYIEKDFSMNDDIDQLRHSATAALFERRDVIVVASVSCIYGLGDPEDYALLMVSVRKGMEKDRDEVIRQLAGIQYERSEVGWKRGTFRVRGDVLEIIPAYESSLGYRIEFFGNEIEKITEMDMLTGDILGFRNHLAIFPASHFATFPEKMQRASEKIEAELEERLAEFRAGGKLLEAQRLELRTRQDLEMMRTTGFCQGIENYSRHIGNRLPGSPPYTLLDYFPRDFLLFIDESHVTVPQITGMYKGDRSRKKNLVDYGFRLPSAYDNRPLNFREFTQKQNQVIYVSATPAEYEKQVSQQMVEQIIRPTGLVDPKVEVRPLRGQVDDLVHEIRSTLNQGHRVLITTLTKRMAENLTEHLVSRDIAARYLHADVNTLERMEIIRDLRKGEFHVLVGINLLREGLDIPEVALVAILDADQEGFLRSARSLIQTIGRAARNIDGRVILYADTITGSIEEAMGETERRRVLQAEYNRVHGIVPRSVIKDISDSINILFREETAEDYHIQGSFNPEERIRALEGKMRTAAKLLEFEKAALLRDEIRGLKKIQRDKNR